MHMIIQFAPLLLFFILYHKYDIYAATLGLMVASTISNAVLWVLTKKISKVDLATYVMIIVFGSAALWFHNPLFIKWKPTILFWLFSLVIWFNYYFRNANTVKWLLDGNITLPRYGWNTLDHLSAAYFGIMGATNMWILLYLSEQAWVSFKTFGIILSSIAFSLLMGIYIVKNAKIIKQL